MTRPSPPPFSADVVRLLVSLDSSVSAVDTEGNTGVCVCVCAWGGGGVRLTISPSFPLLTALHHAAMGNNYVAAKVLVQAKAPVGVVNRLGKSPLVIAQEQRNRYIMQMLTVEEGRGNQRGVVNILLYNQVRHVPGSRVLGSGYAGVRGGGVTPCSLRHVWHGMAMLNGQPVSGSG